PAAAGDDASGEGRVAREVAQRVFAAEFQAANLELKDGGERSPAFVITPLGARVNRLFVVGVLTSNEHIGATGEMRRAQIIDPTGTFNVYAGQYQPEAAAALAEIVPPAIVAVVGKARTYSPEPGVTYTSVRPEIVKVVDIADRDAWVLETARATIERLEAIAEAAKLTTPTAASVEGLGYAKDVADGLARALAHYGKPDLEKSARMVRDALEYLAPGNAERAKEPTFAAASALVAPVAAPVVAAPVRPPAPASTSVAPPVVASPPADAARAAREDTVLALVVKLDDGKGAPWEDLVSEASKSKIGESEVEEALNALMDRGLVYEPVLGRIKKAA
ncbi:MAG: hypothetical protein ACYDCK_05080, partial [Thermoplasmatota archaeon]